MSALVRAEGKNLFMNSFRMSSQVKIELGRKRVNSYFGLFPLERMGIKPYKLYGGEIL